MQNSICKKTHEQLLFLAGNLPLVFVNTHEKHIMTKDELEELGYVGAEKLKDGKYMYKAPVQIAMNHYRGLKRAYKKYGVAGCHKYIDDIKKLKNFQ